MKKHLYSPPQYQYKRHNRREKCSLAKKREEPVKKINNTQERKMRQRAQTFSYLTINESPCDTLPWFNYGQTRSSSETCSTVLSIQSSTEKSTAVNRKQNYRPRTQTVEICRKFSLNCMAEAFIKTVQRCATPKSTGSERQTAAFLNQAEKKLEFSDNYSENEVIGFLEGKHRRRLAIQYSKQSKEARNILKFCLQYKYLKELYIL